MTGSSGDYASRAGSLCTGIGGLDLAVEGHFGADLAWYSEVEPAPCTVLEREWPGVPNVGDLTAVDWSTVEPVDVLTAGYPCQPFSHAGKRKGQDDERHLWPHVAEAVRVLRPRWVVLENVAGHLSLGFGDVLGDLAEAGFDAEWCVLRASDVGAPHQRARLFIVAADADDGRRGGRGSSGTTKAGRGREGGQRGPARAGADAAADADAEHAPQRGGDGRGLAGPAGEGEGDLGRRQRVRGAAHEGGAVAADASGVSEREPADETHAITGGGEARPVARCGGVLAPPDADLSGCHRQSSGAGDGWNPAERSEAVGVPDDRPAPRAIAWGQYEPAIRRWEAILGRPAPRPTDDDGRLSPPFVEWMMGYPAGWVDGLTRTQALKALGNAVVPQQGLAALSVLAPVMEVAA